jgi:hypothetical protein
MFKLLDSDDSGNLTKFELFQSNPFEERAKRREKKKRLLMEAKHLLEPKSPSQVSQSSPSRSQLQSPTSSPLHSPTLPPSEPESPKPPPEKKFDEIIVFRNYLVERFGSKEEAFEALQIAAGHATGTSCISFGELRVGLERLVIHLKQIIGPDANLQRLFLRLDAEVAGELSYHQLMVARPDAHKKRKAIQVYNKRSSFAVDGFAELPQAHMSEHFLKLEEFARSEKMNSLDVRWAHVGREGAHRLATALSKAGKTRKVNLLQLAGNYITTAGLRPLATALEKFCKLEKLVLSWNGIDDVGAERLASTITNMSTLKELDLEHNHISDRGAEHLAKAITQARDSCGLKLLNLEHNLLGLLGMSELRYACPQKLKLKIRRGNAEEATAGCHLKSSKKGASEDLLQSSSLSSLTRSTTESMKSREEDPNGFRNVNPALKVPGEYEHYTLCWNMNANWRLPKADRMVTMLEKARAEARHIKRGSIDHADSAQHGESGLTLFDASASIASSIRPGISQGLKHSSSEPRLDALADNSQDFPPRPQSQSGRRSSSIIKGIGISLDLTQTLPAGDSWPPGLVLSDSLLQARLIGEGKKRIPPRPQSQGSCRQGRRRVGAVSPTKAWQGQE